MMDKYHFPDGFYPAPLRKVLTSTLPPTHALDPKTFQWTPSVEPSTALPSHSYGDRFMPHRSRIELLKDAPINFYAESFVPQQPKLTENDQSLKSVENNPPIHPTDMTDTYALKSALLKSMFDMDDPSLVLGNKPNDNLKQPYSISASQWICPVGFHTSTTSPKPTLLSDVKVTAPDRITPRLSYKAETPPRVARRLDGEKPTKKRVNPSRVILNRPDLVLDAPGASANYYYNILDWSCANFLAIALENILYLFNVQSKDVSVLIQLNANEGEISAVKFSPDGNQVAIGTTDGVVEVWVVEPPTRILRNRKHDSGVFAITWQSIDVLTSASKHYILNHDLPSRKFSSGWKSHQDTVCGLSWSPDTLQLASGGNDNVVRIWEKRMVHHPIHLFETHKASVKAVAWCPWEAHRLATGGGNEDRTMKLWNTQSGQCLNSTQTESQICAIVWSKHSTEMVLAHGYSDHALSVWNTANMTKHTTLNGHTDRVLHMVASPCGTKVATTSPDETLRIWTLFQKQETASTQRPRNSIR